MQKFRCGLALLVLASSNAALAGPPFATDDPEPTAEGGYEIFLFSEGTRSADGFDAALPGLELNYGAGPNLQISAAVEQAYEAPRDGGHRWHYGSAEAGLKYRFVQEDDQGWCPQVSFYPSLTLPEGAHSASTFLPLWAQKHIGSWDVFGGGGLRINPGADSRDSWFAGIAALRPLAERLQVGGEVFRETAESEGEPAAVSFNIAALYDLNQTWQLVASSGRALGAASGANEFSYYLGVELKLAP
jgi:hypothetical protein